MGDDIDQGLDIQNHLFFLTYDGRHCICPKNEGAKRVLDLGTGTGMWAMDFGAAREQGPPPVAEPILTVVVQQPMLIPKLKLSVWI